METIRTDAFAGTPWYDAAPAGAFEEVMLGHVLVRMKGDVPASYEISTNVWMVADNAFAGVTTLSDLYIGTEVVSLWDRAFAGCTSLGSVTVPSGCRELGDYLFEGCTSLTNVFFRGHAPTNDVPNVFSGTPETLKVRVKEGSRGWIAPGSDSDLVPARWPYKTAGGALVPNDLNRAVYEPEDLPGVVRSVVVDGNITNDTTWIGGKVYEIQKACYVREGATLTIEQGAIVKLPPARSSRTARSPIPWCSRRSATTRGAATRTATATAPSRIRANARACSLTDRKRTSRRPTRSSCMDTPKTTMAPMPV